MTEQISKPTPVIDHEKEALNKNLETAFWGLFLIMLGCWWFIPASVAPKGLWSIGVGLILLGLNAVRYAKHIHMSGFTTLLGILALIGGIGEMMGLDLGGAALLIVLGSYLILKPWFDERRIFGKAEHN
jgi:hypothetical protein